MVTTEKKVQADEFVENFKEEFENLFGVQPTVLYNFAVKKIDIRYLEKLTNEVLWENCPDQYQGGIRSKCRQQALAEHRQIFYKLAREMGYHFSYLSRFIGFDHSTAVYSVKKVDSLLAMNDKITVKLYETIKNKLYDKGTIRTTGAEQTEPESDLSAL
jgi:chromosomal replication initiation ATPase DnaA